MYPPDEDKMTFKTERENYRYKNAFGLKNARVTDQRLMDRVFKDLTRQIKEVYVDNVVIKSSLAEDHVSHLEKIFERVRVYNMRINPEKCFFEVGGGKFL